MKRKGLGRGRGKGYYNIVPLDSHIHSLSAKGISLNAINKGDAKRYLYQVKTMNGKIISAKTSKFFPDFGDKILYDDEDYDVTKSHSLKQLPIAEVISKPKPSNSLFANKVIIEPYQILSKEDVDYLKRTNIGLVTPQTKGKRFLFQATNNEGETKYFQTEDWKPKFGDTFRNVEEKEPIFSIDRQVTFPEWKIISKVKVKDVLQGAEFINPDYLNLNNNEAKKVYDLDNILTIASTGYMGVTSYRSPSYSEIFSEKEFKNAFLNKADIINKARKR